MDLRTAREAAIRHRWRDLADNFTAALPRLLDDLEAVDADYAVSLVLGDNIADWKPTGLLPPPDPEEPRPVRRRTTRKAEPE